MGGTDSALLQGGNGNDTFKSKSGDDLLIGGAGNDTIAAEEGNDRLHGGLGNDTLTGGSGRDAFVFDSGRRFKRSIGIDTLTDFQRPDRIVLDKTTFRAIKGKRVSYARVQSIGQAKESAALITYIRSTGALYYNQNGEDAGFGQGRQFADLTGGLGLRRSNFELQA